MWAGMVWVTDGSLFVVQSPFNCGSVIFQVEMLNVNRIDMNLCMHCSCFRYWLTNHGIRICHWHQCWTPVVLLLCARTCILTLCTYMHTVDYSCFEWYVCTYVLHVAYMYSTVVLMALMCVFLCITTTEGHASIWGKYFSTVCVSNFYFHELL